MKIGPFVTVSSFGLCILMKTWHDGRSQPQGEVPQDRVLSFIHASLTEACLSIFVIHCCLLLQWRQAGLMWRWFCWALSLLGKHVWWRDICMESSIWESQLYVLHSQVVDCQLIFIFFTDSRFVLVQLVLRSYFHTRLWTVIMLFSCFISFINKYNGIYKIYSCF